MEVQAAPRSKEAPVEEKEEEEEEVVVRSTDTIADEECCQGIGLNVLFASVPLGLVAYYDVKMGVTALVVVLVLAVIKRIFRMAGCCGCEEEHCKEE